MTHYIQQIVQCNLICLELGFYFRLANIQIMSKVLIIIFKVSNCLLHDCLYLIIKWFLLKKFTLFSEFPQTLCELSRIFMKIIRKQTVAATKLYII